MALSLPLEKNELGNGRVVISSLSVKCIAWNAADICLTRRRDFSSDTVDSYYVQSYGTYSEEVAEAAAVERKCDQ